VNSGQKELDCMREAANHLRFFVREPLNLAPEGQSALGPKIGAIFFGGLLYLYEQDSHLN
jgi:hypothetical protein